MVITLFTLACAMLLVSRLVRRTDASRERGSTSSSMHDATWLVVLTATLAALSGGAALIQSDWMPAIICMLVIPILAFLPGTGNNVVRVLTMGLVAAGAARILMPSGVLARDAGSGSFSQGSSGSLAPVIMFDDAARKKELLNRARTCVLEIDLQIARSAPVENATDPRTNASLTALKDEADSILRTLQNGEGSNDSTALRLTRLESRLRLELGL